MVDSGFLTSFIDKLEKQGMLGTIVEHIENPFAAVICFEKANETDCSLSVALSVDKLEIRRVIGRSVIAQPFDFREIDDNFFDILKEHHDTICNLITMRERIIGQR